MKQILLAIFAVLFVTSCQITGFTSGYSSLSQREKDRVFDYTRAIDSISDDSCVYNITHKQVLEYAANRENLIVYNYTPVCSSKNCISPQGLAEICKEQQIDFLIVANEYHRLIKLATNSGFPVFMINTKEYNTKSRSKYIELFYKELTNTDCEEVNYASYHYFKNGVYVKSFKNYNDIVKL